MAAFFLTYILNKVCMYVIQNLKIAVSMTNFSANLPSSLLAATFGHCLFTPKVFLQKKICDFLISSFSQK